MPVEREICVVTQPLASASESATTSLLEVLSAITTVSLITAHLPADSALREDYEIVELSDDPTGDDILTAASRFVVNQIRMCRAIHGREEDVVLFFGATSYLVPILFSRAIGKTVVLEPRGNVPESLFHLWNERLPTPVAYLASRLVWILERAGYASADAIITLSSGMADDLSLHRYERKLFRNGAWHVDTSRFTPEVPYEDRERRIGYVGRMTEEKGIRELVPLIRALPSDVTFVFVGDGELRSWVATELADEIEAGSVEITGWVDHAAVPERLCELRLLVMASKTEGLPTTILESMACGTPVYAKPVAGVTDVVDPGRTGYLMTADSPAEAAERVESILETTTGEMSDSCRDFVEEAYSLDAAVERYTTILTQLSE